MTWYKFQRNHHNRSQMDNLHDCFCVGYSESSLEQLLFISKVIQTTNQKIHQITTVMLEPSIWTWLAVLWTQKMGFHLLIFVFLLLSEIFSLSKCLAVSTIQQISSTKWKMDLHCSVERIDLLFFSGRNNKGFLLWPNWVSLLWVLLLTRAWSWALCLVSLMQF